MTRRTGDARPLPGRTREALAACEAVGLHYWADHPMTGHVWAVDDRQQAHVVRIRRDDGTAQHVCCRSAPDEKDRSPTGEGSGPEHPYPTQIREEVL